MDYDKIRKRYVYLICDPIWFNRLIDLIKRKDWRIQWQNSSYKINDLIKLEVIMCSVQKQHMPLYTKTSILLKHLELYFNQAIQMNVLS